MSIVAALHIVPMVAHFQVLTEQCTSGADEVVFAAALADVERLATSFDVRVVAVLASSTLERGARRPCVRWVILARLTLLLNRMITHSSRNCHATVTHVKEVDLPDKPTTG